MKCQRYVWGVTACSQSAVVVLWLPCPSTSAQPILHFNQGESLDPSAAKIATVNSRLRNVSHILRVPREPVRQSVIGVFH